MHISSGGVIYTYDQINRPMIVLLYRDKTGTWDLPKGTPEGQETLIETAKREVKEETGVDVEIESYLGFLYSSFERNNSVILKKTHYYLMRYQTGHLQTDTEHDSASWHPISQAIELLDQTNPEFESKIVIKARSILNKSQ
jgi:8-oxo-dGTP pyrophosphatase MutT (NUDIX family)